MVGSQNNLQDAILNTLKQWHENASSPLESLFLVRQLVAERGPLYGNTPTNVARELIADEIESLRKGTHEEQEAARLLIRLYYDGMMIKEYAYESGMSRFALNRRRDGAIKQMAEKLWARELVARESHRAKLLKFVPRPTYQNLIGRLSQQTDLVTHLSQTEDTPTITILVGMGGLGKTSLINAVCHDLSEQMSFEHIFWVVAPSDPVRPHSPEHVYLELLQTINRQLTNHGDRPLEELAHSVRHFLQHNRCLVVVDNVESADTLNYLIPKFADLHPSKLLITSRANYMKSADVQTIRLSQLNQAESLTLLRQKAAELNFPDFATASDTDLAPIYDLTGGNPLALQMVVGMSARGMPLTLILNNLQRGKEGSAWELLTHIYWLSWNNLAPNAKRILKTMLTVGATGLTQSQLEIVARLPQNDLHDAIATLLQNSLLELRGSTLNPRYGIHQLTQTFLNTEIIRREDL